MYSICTAPIDHTLLLTFPGHEISSKKDTISCGQPLIKRAPCPACIGETCYSGVSMIWIEKPSPWSFLQIPQNPHYRLQMDSHRCCKNCLIMLRSDHRQVVQFSYQSFVLPASSRSPPNLLADQKKFHQRACYCCCSLTLFLNDTYNQK